MSRKSILCAATLFVVASACANQITTDARSAIHASKKDSPAAISRVRWQVEILRGDVEVISIKRIGLDDGETGWLISYRQTDQTLGGPRTSMKWLKLGSEGFVVAMSPDGL